MRDQSQKVTITSNILKLIMSHLEMSLDLGLHVV